MCPVCDPDRETTNIQPKPNKGATALAKGGRRKHQLLPHQSTAKSVKSTCTTSKNSNFSKLNKELEDTMKEREILDRKEKLLARQKELQRQISQHGSTSSRSEKSVPRSASLAGRRTSIPVQEPLPPVQNRVEQWVDNLSHRSLLGAHGSIALNSEAQVFVDNLHMSTNAPTPQQLAARHTLGKAFRSLVELQVSGQLLLLVLEKPILPAGSPATKTLFV